MLLRRLLTAAVTLVVLSGAALAQQKAAPDAARLAAARELMEASGSDRQFKAVMPLLGRQMEQAFLRLAPQHSDTIRDAMGKVLDRVVERRGELIKLVAEIYAQKLSLEDLKALTAFYRSGPGARFVAAQPEILKDSAEAGRRWGEAIGREIDTEMRQELKRRGITL